MLAGAASGNLTTIGSGINQTALGHSQDSIGLVPAVLCLNGEVSDGSGACLILIVANTSRSVSSDQGVVTSVVVKDVSLGRSNTITGRERSLVVNCDTGLAEVLITSAGTILLEELKNATVGHDGATRIVHFPIHLETLHLNIGRLEHNLELQSLTFVHGNLRLREAKNSLSSVSSKTKRYESRKSK